MTRSTRGQKLAPPEAAARDQKFIAFCTDLAETPAVLLLHESADPSFRADFMNELTVQANGRAVELGADPFSEFLRWSGTASVQPHLPANLRTALDHRKHECKARRKERARIVATMGLKEASDEEKLAALEARTTQYKLQKLPNGYPTKNYWVAENAPSMTGWKEFVEAQPRDRRMVLLPADIYMY